MSILFAKSFDDGFTDDGIVTNNNPNVSTDATVVRGVHTRSLKLTCNTSTTMGFGYTVPTIAAGWVYTAFYVTGLGTYTVVALLDNATSQIDLRMRTDGRFDLTRNGTVIATSTFAAVASSWVQVAWKFSIANAGGIAKVRFNGSTTDDIDFTGDTQNSANAQVTFVKYGTVALNLSIYVADLVVQDSAGSAPENDWLGDIEALAVWPNGAGDSSQWNIGGSSPAATRHESLDESPPDDATTTVDTNVVNDKLLMTYSDLAVTGGTIYAVMVQARAQKTSAGAREIALMAKSGGTEATGSNKVLTTTWTRHTEIMHDDPSGSAWTGTSVNGAQFGVKLTV